MKKILMNLLFLFGFCWMSIFAQVDSQWRGDERDGKYNGEKLLKQWPADGPELITTIEGLGTGFSSPAVTSNRIYLTGMFDGQGILFAYELNGNLAWKINYGREWDAEYPGARATPAVVGDKIYFISGFGIVFCYDENGQKIWSVDMLKTFQAPNIIWGITESPLIDGDYIYCTPGAEDVSVAVLNRHTGKIVKKIKLNGQWSAYCSPRIVDHFGKKILVTMLDGFFIGIDLDTNKPIFEIKHEGTGGVHPNTPLYHDGYFYIVSGYGLGGELFKLSDDASEITRIWADEKLDNQMGGTILFNGYLYGSGHSNRNWKCIEFKTGKLKYESRELGRIGNIIFADDLLYLYSEKGHIALVKPNPDKFEIISSFKLKAGTGQHWAHPVIKNGRLYVHHGNILNIYNIAR